MCRFRARSLPVHMLSCARCTGRCNSTGAVQAQATRLGVDPKELRRFGSQPALNPVEVACTGTGPGANPGMVADIAAGAVGLGAAELPGEAARAATASEAGLNA